jgi:hypothetical protein
MAEGQLRCVGSSLFLKKTYGVGYQLTIEKHKAGELKKGAVTRQVEEAVSSIAEDPSLPDGAANAKLKYSVRRLRS